MDTGQPEHPHESHLKNYVQLIAAALVGPFIVGYVPLSAYSFAATVAYLALVVWFAVLRLPTPSTKEGGALLLGLLYALMDAFLPIVNIHVVATFGGFLYTLLFTIPLYTVTALMLTVPAIHNKKWFPGGVVAVLILHLVYTILIHY